MLTVDDNLLDTRAAAQHCNYSYAAFVRLRLAGHVPPPDVWCGKRPFYRPETLSSWLVARPKKTWRLVPPTTDA